MDNRRNYCCYPYRRHKRRIYLSLPVLSATVIAKHPSLPLKTGDVMCCNCLIAITHTVDTSVGSTSSMISDECPGPSNLASPPGTEPTTKICGTLCSTESSEGSDNDHQLDNTATELHSNICYPRNLSYQKRRSHHHSETYLVQKVYKFGEAVEKNLQLFTGVITDVLHRNDGIEIAA